MSNMNVDVKLICPECNAGFVECNIDGVNLFTHDAKYMRCPEPFGCELSGKVYKKPVAIELEEV